MKKLASNLFYFFILLCLIGIIADWFFHFDPATKALLRALMFSLIGIAFISSGYVKGRKWVKIIFALCGGYLIIMRFMPEFEVKDYLAIVAIIIPLYIEKAFPELNEGNGMLEK